ncbi:MAG: lipopolysaccharide kinase InaA family protein [Gemmatimonadaceae bacterium]|nr:lipopolysaccharide kinase InaA family protein [Gemmatimonadaceae bacterium]
MAIAVPMPGYAKIRANGARGLAVESCLHSLQSILESETLHEYAARQPDARRFMGRALAYGITLGQGCGDVVVRHAMRGGFLARTGSDLFLPPTRGLRELMNSLRLRLAGVPTPEVIAFVSYRAGPLLRRSDVATREIPQSHDLAVVLREMRPGDDRDACLRATGLLLASLARAGAHHPDLNARNILIAWDAADGAGAHVLDVDRIRFHVRGDPMVAKANMARLDRSLRKLRETESLEISDAEIGRIRSAASEAMKR